MAGAGAISKLCVKCGTDVASKPRVKDPHGQYLCQPCFDVVQAGRGKGAPKAAPAPAERTAKAVAELDLPADDGIFGVVDLDALKPLADAPRPKELKICPACGKARDKESVLCVHCGFDERAGFQRGTGVGASAKKGGKIVCPHCGYDLKGLNKPRCPECGKIIPMVTEKDERAAESKAIAKKAYLKPILMLVIGLGGLVVFGAMQGQTGNILVLMLVKYAVGLPIGLLVYVICCLAWIGFDAPLHRVTLSLAGIYAVCDLVSAVLGLIPIAVIGWCVTVITYIGLLMDELDLDLTDAVIVALATWVAKVFLGLIIAVAILQLFGGGV